MHIVRGRVVLMLLINVCILVIQGDVVSMLHHFRYISTFYGVSDCLWNWKGMVRNFWSLRAYQMVKE